jgi:hypothetical protein
MTNTYNVHIDREMRLLFEGIEADAPETAAAIAADKPTDDAKLVEDCNGDNLAALVDEAGDEQYERSVMIDFELERQRKAAGKMLAALRAFIEAEAIAEECHEWKWENLAHAFRLARDAVADANAAPITAASEMQEALLLAQRALNTAPRFRVGDTDSYAIAAIVDKVIHKATTVK